MVLVALGAGLALVGYVLFEPLDRSGWTPAVLRALAWSVLALLLVNPGCAIGTAASPLVLLDGSLSMTAAGGSWGRALSLARVTGEVRLFGDPSRDLDSLPEAGHSRLGPALAAAAATGRPVTIITDGEIEDRATLPPDLLRASTVRVLPRSAGPAVAVRSVTGPDQVSVTDTVELMVELATRDVDDTRPLRLVVRLAGRELAVGTLRAAEGSATTALRFQAADLGEGDHLLEVGLADQLDSEPRDDLRLHALRVASTPGVVLVTADPDWESRFLLAALRDVTSTPVVGYALIAPGEWRQMTDLQVVPVAVVNQAYRGADVAVVLGTPPGLVGPGPRAQWRWPSPGPDPAVGDWYLTLGGASPIGAAFGGLAPDSFPPAQVLVRAGADSGAGWTAVVARSGRRGAEHPALIGRELATRREVSTLVRGLWRWSFRGGVTEQAYRALVAETIDWLLGTPRPETSQVRLVRPVVSSGTAVGFRWQGSGPPAAVPITVSSTAGPDLVDTLRFGGDGQAGLFLPVGSFSYSIPGGGSGRVAVEPYSPEWFPRAVALSDGDPAAVRRPPGRGVRDQLWLFGLAVAALCTEWFVRRRRGLR